MAAMKFKEKGAAGYTYRTLKEKARSQISGLMTKIKLRDKVVEFPSQLLGAAKGIAKKIGARFEILKK